MASRTFWLLVVLFYSVVLWKCSGTAEACTVVPVIDTTVINCMGCK